jgi:hypothetical protein
MTRPSSRDRRAVALGAFVVGFVLFVFRVLPLWRSWDEDRRAAAAELAGEVERTRAGVRWLPGALDSVEARSRRVVALAPLLVPGNTPAAASASLASLVSGAAAKAHVDLGALQLRPDSAGETSFTRVAVRGDATGDLPGILRMLSELEGGRELLVVRVLSITQPAAGGPGDQPEALRLEFSVEALAHTRRTPKEGR